MDKIFEIEEKYAAVKDLQINATRIWPLYRIVLRFLLLNGGSERSLKKQPDHPAGFVHFLRKKYYAFRHFCQLMTGLPDFRKWWRSYDYIIFSNKLEQKQVNGVTIDKLATGLIEQLGEERTLLISYPAGNTPARSGNLKHKNFVDGQLINSLTGILRHSKTHIPEKDRQWTDKIRNEYHLSDDGLAQIEFSFRKIKVLTWFLKKWKPRLVINCCYTYHAEVFAAKRRGIRTIELQHGIISPLHPGYESRLSLDKDFSAEYLLSFGVNSTRNLSNNIVNLAKTLPVGNLYLEEMFHAPPDPAIQTLTGRFEYSVCAPTDSMTEEEVMSFIVELAKKNPRIGYLIVPRLDLSEQIKDSIAGMENIIVLTGLSFQNVVRHCTVHTATVSSCCLEALSLGVPNILINTDGRAKFIYGDLLGDKYTSYVGNTDEYFLSLESLKGYSKEDIRNSNDNNFSAGYRENLSKALKTIQS